MTPRTPAKVERELQLALTGRRLAGELRLSEDDLDELEACVDELVGSGLGANALASSYPALLVTYLTFVGVYRYEGGTFWPKVPVAGRLGSSVVGEAFKRAVKVLGLRSFDDLVADQGAVQYVARILAHGGIPRYCLGDFFGALHTGLRQAGSADDLLALWRTRPERLANLDKPIGRFLGYGADEARDLLIRCTELVDETVANGQLPTADSVGLPAYLVDEYGRWRRRSPPAYTTSRVSSIPRPRVEIDPWSTTGPHLVLPAISGPESWWMVTGDGGAGRSVRASDIREQLVRLEPSRSWDVTLEASGAPQRLFAYEAFGELPALLFDPTTSALVRDPLNVRLDRVVCLYPEDSRLESLSSDGNSLGEPRAIERYPSPTGEWRGFKLCCFDLAEITRLRIIHGETERIVRVATRASRPTLQGATVTAVTTADGRTVYSSAPRVSVPEDLRGFEWSARIRRGIETLSASKHRADGEGYLDLMAAETFGEIDVHLTGVLGFDLHERVAVVPGLEVRLPTQLLFPDDTGASISVKAGEGLSIDQSSPPMKVAIPDDGDTASFLVSDREGREVELRMQVPRVVWGVVADAGSGAGFTTDVVRLDASDVEQGRARALVLRTGKPGLQVKLCLTSRTGVILQEPDGGLTREEGRWAFDLRPFQDAVRQSTDPVMRLKLSVGPRSVHVADILVRYAATDISATSRTTDEFAEVVVRFAESGVVDGRVVRLWSLDRPWEDAIEDPIPDGQGGQAVVAGYSRIPVGPYTAEIAVDDGWSRRRRPAIAAPSTGRILVGDYEGWRARIVALDPADALQALEAVVAEGHVSDETLNDIDFGEAAPQALATFVWLLDSAPRGEALPHSKNAVRKALLDSFDGLLRALAAAPDQGIPDSAIRRIELLCVRGFDKDCDRTRTAARELEDDELRGVWRTVPVLATAVDLTGLDEGLGASQRLEQLLGSGEDGLPNLAGFHVDARLLGRPAELLLEMARLLDIYPGPLLERRTLEAACFEFLVAEGEFETAAGPFRPSLWFDRHVYFVQPLLAVQGYRAALEPRLAPVGVMPWSGLLAVTLAAAIHVRRQTRLWAHATRALDEALCFAPAVVRHDLIAAQVLIHRLRRDGQPC